MQDRIAEIHRSVEAGAQEIDIVITRALVFEGKMARTLRRSSHVQASLRPGTHEGNSRHGRHPDSPHVARASFTAMMAGADFIKNLHRQRTTNATLPSA